MKGNMEDFCPVVLASSDDRLLRLNRELAAMGSSKDCSEVLLNKNEWFCVGEIHKGPPARIMDHPPATSKEIMNEIPSWEEAHKGQPAKEIIPHEKPPLVEVEYTVQYDDNDDKYAGYRWLLHRSEDHATVLHSSLERGHLFPSAESAFAAAVQVALVYETLVASHAQCVIRK